MQESEQVWLAVVNLHAGSGKTASLWKAAEKLMDRMDIRHDNKYTDFKYHAAEIAYEAAASGFRKFIAVGGDGTIHEVLEGIMKYVGECSSSRRSVRISDFYLAVIPIGSGNDWIRIHNIGYRAGDTLKLIRENSFVSQDIVKVTAITDAAGRAGTEGSEKVSSMVNVGGVGFDTLSFRLERQDKFRRRQFGKVQRSGGESAGNDETGGKKRTFQVHIVSPSLRTYSNVPTPLIAPCRAPSSLVSRGECVAACPSTKTMLQFPE